MMLSSFPILLFMRAIVILISCQRWREPSIPTLSITPTICLDVISMTPRSTTCLEQCIHEQGSSSCKQANYQHYAAHLQSLTLQHMIALIDRSIFDQITATDLLPYTWRNRGESVKSSTRMSHQLSRSVNVRSCLVK